MKFQSKLHEVGLLQARSMIEIKLEPMLFSASLDFAMENGGAITKEFIGKLPMAFRDDPTACMDSRVHMLMPGWFPCIPGWHHDDVPRNTHNGQPNYIDPPYKSTHVMALVNGDIAPTQFLVGEVEVPKPKEGSSIYKQWDDYIETQRTNIKSDELRFRTISVVDRMMYQFDCDTFHRGTMAIKDGWRWFGRVSIGRKKRATGEIRSQVQVYLPTINAGW